MTMVRLRAPHKKKKNRTFEHFKTEMKAKLKMKNKLT
jgi:hypothetical protein